MPDFSDKPLFRESQRFRQLWIWLIMGGSTAITILAVVIDLFTNSGGGFSWESLIGMGIAMVTMVGSLMLFASTSLQTEVRHDGWYYRFWPFRRKYKSIKWEDVERFEIKKYKPIGDFGGWGYRKGIFGKGDAFSIQGNIGLQLFLKNGKKTLFGTQSPEELQIALEHLFLNDEEMEYVMDLEDPEKTPLYSKELREDLLDDD